MKKIIALFITILLFISCFCMSVSANEDFFDSNIVNYNEDSMALYYTTTIDKKAVITFSEDYKTLYVDKEKYVTFSGEYIYTEVLAELENKINLTDAQKSEVSVIDLTASEKGALIDAIIEFNDGTEMYISYIKSSCLSEYKKLLNSDTATYKIEFEYPENNTVISSRDKLFGEKYTIKNTETSIVNYFYVYIDAKDQNFTVTPGVVIDYNDEFYYYDFIESNSTPADMDIYNANKLTVHKITDPETVANLQKALDRYYSEDLGFFVDDNFSEKVAKIFTIIIFSVVPFAALIAFVIFAIKSKGIYRKLYIITSSLLAGELVIFAIIALLIN